MNLKPAAGRALTMLAILSFAISTSPAAASPGPGDELAPGLVLVIPDVQGRAAAEAQDAVLSALSGTAPIELLRNPHDGSVLLHVTAEGRRALALTPRVLGVLEGIEEYPKSLPDAVRVLVTVRGPRRPDDATRDRLAAKLAAAGAAEVRRTVNTHSMTFDVPLDSVWVLNQLEEIASYALDTPSSPSLAESIPLVGITSPYSYPYGQQFVAVLDTGVRSGWPLTNRVATEYAACFSHAGGSFASLCPGGATEAYGPSVAEPCTGSSCASTCEHGSNVASVIVQNSPPGIIPVNYNARVIPIQIYSITGTGLVRTFTNQQEQALDYVISLKQAGVPVNVVNMSFGNSIPQTTACPLHQLADEVGMLKNLGVAVIAAAGNRFGTGTFNGVQSPACIPDLIAVGATTDTGDQVAVDIPTPAGFCGGPTTFSTFSHGLVDLWAPGANITMLNYPAGYATRVGTSFSAPHVAGIWLRLRAKFPAMSNDAILAMIVGNCPPRTDSRNGVTKPRVCMLPSWF